MLRLSLFVAINLACAAIVQPFEITANSASDTIANKTFSYVIVGGGTAGEQYIPVCCQWNTQSIPS